jgi:BMFP domain-containing protein YqiC
MTQSNQPERDLFTRVAQLEYRLNKIEHNQEQLENTMTPGGYITEAFERVHEEIDEFRSDVNSKLDAQNQKLDEQNRKIDIILRHITGLSGDNS